MGRYRQEVLNGLIAMATDSMRLIRKREDCLAGRRNYFAVAKFEFRGALKNQPGLDTARFGVAVESTQFLTGLAAQEARPYLLAGKDRSARIVSIVKRACWHRLPQGIGSLPIRNPPFGGATSLRRSRDAVRRALGKSGNVGQISREIDLLVDGGGPQHRRRFDSIFVPESGTEAVERVEDAFERHSDTGKNGGVPFGIWALS